MDERRDDEDEQPRVNRPTEGVRIIGAEEAQAAIEAGQVAGRRPDDAPRFGDVPEPPSGPRPPLRFPLGADEDPSEVPRPPVSSSATEPPDEESSPFAPPSTELPHWTEPPSGENPRILAGESTSDDLGA